VILVALVLAGTGSCYRPSLKDGGLLCATTSPFCPEGYSCHQDRRCYKSAADAGADDTKMDGPASDRDGGGGAGGSSDGSSKDMDGASSGDGNSCVLRQATAGCTPQAELACDPVCQTGCCTDEKCTTQNRGTAGANAGTLGCAKGSWLRNLGETCDVTNAGTALRTDNCLPGLLCVAGDSDKICMKLCRGDADCAGDVTCESRQIERPGTYLASVCGLPTTTCNPASGIAITGCPAGRTCYLIRSSAGDRTVCDLSSGEGTNAASCTAPIDCLPGWTCPLSGPGAARCRPVCSHDAQSSSAACPIGLTCQTTGTTYDLCL